ncbi:MAG: sugar ABC transporter substrate-binding protein [Brachybacterium faecium]|nr:MAG: sugar ABC transporter substrate-binding protein [Brachybacterium faecium]
MNDLADPRRFTPSRRALLGALGIGAAFPALAACGGGDPKEEAAEDVAANAEVELPTYTEQTAVEPDIPGQNGSTPGYTTYPQDLPQTVEAPPGSGSTFTLMVPTWSAVKSNLNNAYTQALDEALGAKLDYQMTTGNDYRDKQAAVFASPNDVADWVAVFGWNPPARFDQAVESVFQDLTPFIGGDKISKWKNLANLPTAAWQFGVFKGKVYGIPVPGEIVTDAIFYRGDIFEELGLEAPTNAEEFLAVCEEITDPGANRWATNDMNTGAPNLMFGAPPDWRIDDGALVYRWETQEYRDALEFQIQLFEKGLVHPDVAADTGDAKQRFESGQVAIHYDGVGAWGESTKRVQASNPDYRQVPMSGLSASGGDPIRYTGSAANFFSFLKKSDDTARIEELLGIANYLAAPFGTKEWETVNFGVEGTHFERGEGGTPEATEALSNEHPGVLSTLVTGPVAKYDFTDPDHVKEYCEWMAGETQYMVEGPFYGQQVPKPAEYASLDQPMYDLEKDIVRGRKTMDDFDAAVETWRSNGGDRMREYYQGIYDELEK